MERKFPSTAADYQLLEEVGQGVSAIVYRALCVPLKEIVAIKNLDLERCNSNLEEMRREAKTMSLINHPNVVKAYCSFVVDHSLWVVMPYMGGGSCLHIMKAAFPDGFEEAVIATILKETLKALEYLHRQGHIHRDVKAGNILVDVNGTVKLGDFGVSACLFDTGDRQRARNTFVGTPCWMAPEVMEQLHGYDFKADIWSFGITALELAHGHAPFSKYPPMKVLLMTLQNAPPGLDYERDRRFSKSFKEMIAMCLVKDPSKRPTAEKLMKHSFFKGAKSPDYLVRRVLDGLPPLWERVKTLKANDAVRLAQKKMPYGEQEERSQSEYKRGVSCWNFDVEDLKAQAALVQDDDALSEKSDDSGPSYKESPEIVEAPGDIDRSHSPPFKSETTADMAERTARARLVIPMPKHNGSKQVLAVSAAGRKEPKHIGRFDVFEDDMEESPGWLEGPKLKVEDSGEPARRDEKEERDRRRIEAEEHHHRKSSSGPLISDRVLASCRDDRERLSVRGVEELIRSKSSFSGPLPLGDHQKATNGPGPSRAPAGSKEDEKAKGTLVRGRFRVTSGDSGTQEEVPHGVGGTRRIASMQQFPTSSSMLSAPNGTASVAVAALFPQLQSLLQQNAAQQDTLIALMGMLSSGDAHSALRNLSAQRSLQRSPFSSEEIVIDQTSEKERELLQQLTELQTRVVTLTEELHNVKSRNVQLERQLNAIYNKEEEERIRREEAG